MSTETDFPDDENGEGEVLRRMASEGTDLRSPRSIDFEHRSAATMIPTHTAITQTELRLGALAQSFGGFPDGWGCMSNPDGSPIE